MTRVLTGTQVVVFDVNETLSDLAPMGRRFADVGAPEMAAKVWFAALLRDGFALTAAGGFASFADVADGALRAILAGFAPDRDTDSAVRHILDGFTELEVHPDVPDGVRALRAAGLRLVTLTNGSTDTAERLLTDAGIRGEFEHLMSVDSAGAWKPSPDSYRHAAETCCIAAERMLLVAVHPWDIHGAAGAGMRTAWLNRSAGPYPAYFTPPDLSISALTDLPDCLEPVS